MLKKLLLVILLIFSNVGYSLEEPPGSEKMTEEEVLEFLEKIQEAKRKAGIVTTSYPIVFPEVEKSWDGGILFAPHTAKSLKIKNAEIDGVHPVLIYMHGCTGIAYDHDVLWAKEIAKLGFVVVMPNSFSRVNRISNCDARTRTSGMFKQVWRYRQEEIAYTLAKLKSYKWADTQNFFLMGHSEGGVATAESNFTAFKGKIISGWSCTNKQYPTHDRINADPKISILVLLYDRDPWYVGTPYEGECSRHAEGRKDFKQILMSGSIHATYQNNEARKAVNEFLTRLSKN
jgi:dienelactone hydrolase